MTIKNQAIQTALTGDWQNAIVLNKELLQENPQDIDALNRLALAFTVTGNIKEAKSAYQKVLNIDPLNHIAIKNLKKVKDKNFSSLDGNGNITQINNKFLEETGKTKVVELVNIAQPNVTEGLRTGQMVNLVTKRLKVFVIEGEKQYVGVLPDDIGNRLIKFMKSGNKYEAYIKSSTPHKVIVFIKEVKRCARYKDQPSFITVQGPFAFDKNNKIKNSVKKRDEEKEDEEEEESYQESEDEE